MRKVLAMRIAFTPPTEGEFKHLFLSTPLRKGGGLDDISIFTPKGLPYRRGSGVLSFISGVAKRILPFLMKAAKPAAKEFGSSLIKDVVTRKKPLRKALKKNGLRALKKTGLRLISGAGKKIKKKKKKRKRKMCRKYKRDIFDGV